MNSREPRKVLLMVLTKYCINSELLKWNSILEVIWKTNRNLDSHISQAIMNIFCMVNEKN